MKTTITVCKRCGDQVDGKDADGIFRCAICGCLEVEDIELPEEIECDMCGKLHSIDAITKKYIGIPNFNAKTMTFYCGCRGWD